MMLGPGEGENLCGRSLPLVEINIGLLADQVAVSATDTLDLGQGVHHFLLAIDLKASC